MRAQCYKPYLRAAALTAAFLFCAPLCADAGLPSDVCFEHCGARQLQMWERFERGRAPDLSALPKVYAGVCHVLGGDINPQREHHVGFLFDRANENENRSEGGGTLNMRFSFFTPAQPYDEFTAAAARAFRRTDPAACGV